MANPQTPASNIGYGFNPFDWSRGTGVGGKAESVFDPFNLSGWNQKPTVSTAGPQPDRPNYIVGYDPATMSLTDYLQGKYDHSGFDKFKGEAMRKGPSAWATMADQDQKARAADQREKGAAATNASTAQATDQIAARGGLSSGARERAATEGSKNYLSMAQDIGRQENLNHMQIGMNDEQNRIQQLSGLPGMEMGQANMWENAKNADVTNTLGENARRNSYNQNVYQQQMAAWAANKQADATQNSGKK